MSNVLVKASGIPGVGEPIGSADAVAIPKESKQSPTAGDQSAANNGLAKNNAAAKDSGVISGQAAPAPPTPLPQEAVGASFAATNAPVEPALNNLPNYAAPPAPILQTALGLSTAPTGANFDYEILRQIVATEMTAAFERQQKEMHRSVSLRSRSNAATSLNSADINKLASEVQHLKNNRELDNAAVQAKLEEHDKACKKIAVLETTVNTHVLEIDQLKKQLAAEAEERKKTTEELNEKIQQLKRATDELDKVKSEKDKLAEELEKLRQEKDELEHENQLYKQKLVNQRKYRNVDEDNMNKLADYENKIAEYLRHVRSLEADIAKLNFSLDLSDKKIKDLQDKLTQKEQLLQEQWSRQSLGDLSTGEASPSIERLDEFLENIKRRLTDTVNAETDGEVLLRVEILVKGTVRNSNSLCMNDQPKRNQT